MDRVNNNTCKEQRTQQEGIALIVVLGILTLITLLAVSFAITMRTERLAAQNYVEGVKARHLLDTALAEAIFEVDEYISKGGAIGTNTFYPDFSRKDPPLKDVFYSFGYSNAPLDLLDGEASSYVPNDLWDAADESLAEYEWERIYDPQTKETVGRYTYIVLDCSGFLDANYVGTSNRNCGLYPQEMNAGVVNGISPLSKFIEMRDTVYFRFESLAEIVNMDTDVVDVNTLDSVFGYSWFPEGMHFRGSLAPTTSLVMINNTNRPDYKSKVVAAFEASGIPNPEGVYDNLLDYMDEDDFPQDPDSFCTEAIPMFNEVVFSNRFTRVLEGSNVVHKWNATLYIETWHPFPETSPNCVLDPSAAFQIYPATSKKPDGNIPNIPFSQNKFSFSAHQFNLPEVKGPASDIPQVIRVNIYATNYISDIPVDSLPNPPSPPAPPFQFEFDFRNPPPDDSRGFNATNMPLNEEVGYFIAKSVPDPRMNGYAAHWLSEGMSLGAMNLNAFNWGEGPSAMFVRNGLLQSIGELGFLSVSGVWETISLYPHSINRQDGKKANPFHPVLDYFTLGTNSTGSFRPYDIVTEDTNIICKGSVNLNTRHQKVLESVLLNTPVEHYPAIAGVPSIGDVVGTKAAAYAQAIMDRSSKTNFHRMSEMGDVDELYLNLANDYNANIQLRGIYSDAPANFISDSVKESIIRNAHQLFGTRQNLFTIILAAQVIDGSNPPAVFSEQRAVAVVWRDPMADATGRHPTFVRFFKLLAE